MTTLQLIILGIVQGITEFLPISSSAHLILVPKLLHVADQGLLVDLGAHAGTLLALILLFRHEVWRMILGFFDVVRRRKTDDAKLFTYLLIGTIPGAFFGFILKDYDEVLMRHLTIIIFTSIFWGAVLWWVDQKRPQTKTLKNDFTLKNTLFVGIAQCLALIPGTSRSGITMTASRFLGFERLEAARFSFLLSIPVTALAVAWGVFEILRGKASGESIHAFIVVAIVSFITALGALAFLLRWLRRFSFTPFVIYRFCLGLFLIWWVYIAHQ